jgi:hypothetical protein
MSYYWNEALSAVYREACNKPQAVDELVKNKTVVGYLRVSEPVARHDASFECAAWWVDTVSATGVFEVTVVREYHSKELRFQATLPATIVADNFQALWGGVAIGDGYDTKQNAGKPARYPTVVHESIVNGVCKSSHSDGGGNKWAILPEFWPVFETFAREELEKAIAYLPIPLDEFKHEGDGNHRKNVTQLAYAGDKISRWGRAVDEIARHVGYGTEYFYKNNTFVPVKE